MMLSNFNRMTMLVGATRGAYTSPCLASLQMRNFARASKYVGVNDNIRQEKRQMRKYGMKRHFYDKVQLDKSSMPTEQ